MVSPPRPPVPAPVPVTVPVTGVVLAMGSADVVPAVGLAVDGQPAAETDGEGRFQLRLTPGRHTIQVQHPGYLAFTEAIDVDATAGAALTLRLVPTRAPGEYETVVRPPAREAPQLTLEKSEITMTPGSLGDPFRVIESLPGVVPVLWPLPIYAVRGSNPGNTGYFIDGLRVPALFHFALGPAVIHPQFLDSLTFYPSAYPPGYGRYVGGVVAAETATAPNDRLRGSLDVRLYDAAVTRIDAVQRRQGHGRGRRPLRLSRGDAQPAAGRGRPALLGLPGAHRPPAGTGAPERAGAGLVRQPDGQRDELHRRRFSRREDRRCRSRRRTRKASPSLSTGWTCAGGRRSGAGGSWPRSAPVTIAPPRPTTTTPICRSAARACCPGWSTIGHSGPTPRPGHRCC